MRTATRAGPRTFDPVRLGGLETDAWAGYYRHEWAKCLRAFVGMVSAGFGMSRRRTLLGAWYILRANQAWAPYPDNDPDAAGSTCAGSTRSSTTTERWCSIRNGPASSR
jgi:hypothetical protein